MKKTILAVSILVLTGCSTTAEKYNLTQENKYANVEELKPFTYDPSLPSRPSMVPFKVDGIYYAGVSNEGLGLLLNYSQKSEKNVEVLNALMNTHTETVKQYNNLLQAVKSEEKEANTYKFMYGEKQDELDAEKRASALEKLLYQIGLGLVVVLSFL